MKVTRKFRLKLMTWWGKPCSLSLIMQGLTRDLLADMPTAVCASLLPVLQSMVDGGMCKCSGYVAKVKVALQRHNFWIDEVEQYTWRYNIIVHILQEEDG